MKIYAAKQSTLAELQKFVKKDVWVLFDMYMPGFSFVFGEYINLISVSSDEVQFRVAMDKSTFNALGWTVIADVYRVMETFDSHDLRTLPTNKFTRLYKLHTPLDVYTTQEIRDMVDATEVIEE